MSSDIKVVELFAGVGGFRIGLESASPRYKTIWANQYEPKKKTQHAFDCYVKNFGLDNAVNEDIAKVKHLVPDHDLLVGGFPCQDYSVASTGAKGIEGQKGVLWWEIRDIVSEKKPKFILLENVDRLLKSPTAQRGRDFGIMLRCLWDLGYLIEWRVINSADYGMAQRRKRTFIFATRLTEDLKKQFEEVTEKDWILKEGLFAKAFPVGEINSKKIDNFDLSQSTYPDLKDLSDSFCGSFYNSGLMTPLGTVLTIETIPVSVPPIPLREVLEKDKVDSKYFLSENLEKWKYLKGAKKIPRIKPNGEPYFYTEGGMSFPDSLDAPARTILTSESSLNRSTHVVEDKASGKLRLLTPVECERLNGFPDNWTNTGMPNKFRYFVMGNALVIPIIEKIGKELVNYTK